MKNPSLTFLDFPAFTLWGIVSPPNLVYTGEDKKKFHEDRNYYLQSRQVGEREAFLDRMLARLGRNVALAEKLTVKHSFGCRPWPHGQGFVGYLD